MRIPTLTAPSEGLASVARSLGLAAAALSLTASAMAAPTASAPIVAPQWLSQKVTLSVGGAVHSRFQVPDGQYHTELISNNDLAVAVFRKGSQYDLLVANAFPNKGTLAMPAISVTFPTGTSGSFPAQSLLPGQCITLCNETGGLGPGSGPATDGQPVIDWYNDWKSLVDGTGPDGSGGFNQAGDVLVFGGSDAVEGGGHGIYPWIEYYARFLLGQRMTYEVMRGWAHRMLLCRWSYGRFAAGIIAAYDPGQHAWAGVDRTHSRVPMAYRDSLYPGGLANNYKVGGFNALDQAHFGRMTHSTAYLAKEGYPLAKVLLMNVAEDVRLSWCYTHPSGSLAAAQLNNPSPGPNFNWWNCDDIIAGRFPPNIGCFWTGRNAGQALMALAAAVEVFPGDYDSDLTLMLDAMSLVHDPSRDTIFRVPEKIWQVGQIAVWSAWPVSNWCQSVMETNPLIPGLQPGTCNASFQPDVAKQFQNAIIFCGLAQARHAQAGAYTGGSWSYDPLLASLLTSITQHDSRLRVFGNASWSDPDKVLWSPLLYGVSELTQGGPYISLFSESAMRKPFDSGNPCAAFLGGYTFWY